MTKAGEQPTITQPLRKIAQLDGDGLPEHTPQVMVHIANAALANSCDLGVGCEEAGVCYAKANGKPEMCHRTTSLAAQDGLVDALEGLIEQCARWSLCWTARYRRPQSPGGDKGKKAMIDTLIDCDTCYGEGWCWDLALNDERPCTDCDGLGFVRQLEVAAIKGDKS